MSRTDKKKRKLNIARLSLIVFLLLCAIVAGTGIGLLAGFTRDMPAMDNLADQLSISSYIYNADGSQEIAALHHLENREIVELEQIPEHVRQAFVATEDERFYQHFGVDIRAVFRAFRTNIIHGRFAEGFSTITMQLAGNAFLDRGSKDIKRKLQECVLAVQLERLYTKDDILEMYLNQVFLGSNAHGVQTAAKHYFGKDVGDLNLAEGAMIAGLARSPNFYSPHSNLTGAKNRQDVVLSLMVRNKMISEAEAEAARNVEITLATPKPLQYNSPYFVDYVLKQLLDKYGDEVVYSGGLRVYTTIDTEIQKTMEDSFREVLNKAFPPKDGVYAPQAAMVVLDPHTGYIKAMVGGRNHDSLLSLNRVLRPKLPGSAFKPIVVYAPAIANGYHASYIVDDAPVSIPIPGGTEWTPRNYDGKFHGHITLREAIARSVNIVAVKLIVELGVNTGIDFAQKLGITTLELENRQINDWGPAISLGGLTKGVTPLELTAAYGVFAAGGKKAEPMAIIKVVDRFGKVLEENKPMVREVLDPKVAYIITDMLKGTISLPYGTGSGNANIGRPAAGKTGTTSEDYDAWFVGYTPELAAAIWLGNDYDKSMGRVYGGSYPAQIWARVMKAGLKGKPIVDFPRPEGLTTAAICSVSGNLPGVHCPSESIVQEIFIPGSEPTEACKVHQVVQICTESQKPATEFCPIRVTKVDIRWSDQADTCDIHTSYPPDPILLPIIPPGQELPPHIPPGQVPPPAD